MSNEKTIDDFLLIPVLNSGEKLYHYTSAAGLKGICCEKEFWVTEGTFLNDSMEFHVATDIICEVLAKHMKNKNLCEKIQKKICYDVENLQKPSLKSDDKKAYGGDYVISFCKDYDSPLMWSSYSDYAGYCIQFDFDKLMDSFSEGKHLFLHGAVVYDHDIQVKLIEDLIELSYFKHPDLHNYLRSWDDFDNMTDEDIDDWVGFVSIEMLVYNMFFKLPCFEGEHEYRFVFMVGHHGGQYKKEDLIKQWFRIRDGVLMPYIKISLNSLDSIERILVGAKNKSDIAIKGVKYLFRNLECDIIVEKSKIPLRY